MDVETAPHFPDRLRLKLAFDPSRLAADLECLREVVWTEHFVKQNYDGDWSVIPLRAAAGATHPIMMIYSDPTATAFADTPLLARTPYFRAVLAAFQCPLQAVRLMRLAPGSVIKEHRDGDLAFEHGAVRLHVPIVTSPQVEFRLNGSRVVMESAALGICGCPIRIVWRTGAKPSACTSSSMPPPMAGWRRSLTPRRDFNAPPGCNEFCAPLFQAAHFSDLRQ